VNSEGYARLGAMKSHYTNLVRVALLYGGACYIIQLGFSSLGWSLFPDNVLMKWGLGIHDWPLVPDQSLAPEFMRQLQWTGQMITDKIAGLILLSITAFFASRAHHPTRKWGLATAVAAAAAYQIIAALVYILRFGMTTYVEYNNILETMFCTIDIAWLFGYFAVRAQYLRECKAV
jgi:hypothetical protein